MQMMRTAGGCVVVAMACLSAGSQLVAHASVLANFRGDWVPQHSDCRSAVRLRVTETTLTLVNGPDSHTWGDVAVPTTYFGPDYTGISVVALPDFEGSQPFTVYFNADEQTGVTKVNIYTEMREPMNPQLAAIQAAAKQLATRFPLNDLPLKQCRAA
jgi:hypothetical protein